MKNMTFAAIAAAFLVAPALAGAQSPSPSPSPSPATAPAPRAAEQKADKPYKADKAETARGELVKVDAEAKKITIKNADGIESVYAYTDATEVAGGRDGVAGLATKSGSKVVVHFTSEAATKTATKIEMQDGASSTRPSPRP